MKNRLLLALAAMGFAGASVVGLTATPASAHIYDDLAGFSCVLKRPFPHGWSFELVHAHPLVLTNDYVLYGCYANVLANWCRWEVFAKTLGGFEGPVNVTGPTCG